MNYNSSLMMLCQILYEFEGGFSIGKQLSEMYKKVKLHHGEIGLYRVIVKTKISKELAQELEDNEFNIEKVKNALSKLGLDLAEQTQVRSRLGRLRKLFRRN
ncbi:MAG: hypothetical protein GPJ54_19420 [Candidatus Heimdallarchaeota archaeon]|nr:hypothetical protein [Candidatus Heimdallarchaeota archaeon]